MSAVFGFSSLKCFVSDFAYSPSPLKWTELNWECLAWAVIGIKRDTRRALLIWCQVQIEIWASHTWAPYHAAFDTTAPKMLNKGRLVAVWHWQWQHFQVSLLLFLCCCFICHLPMLLLFCFCCCCFCHANCQGSVNVCFLSKCLRWKSCKWKWILLLNCHYTHSVCPELPKWVIKWKE